MLKFRNLLTIFIAFFIFSCSTPKSWVYKNNNVEFSGKKQFKYRNSSVVVKEFEDVRADKNSNNAMLYLIPLFPFGYQNFDTPESSSMHINSGPWNNYRPSEDFAKALAKELESTETFKEVYFSNRSKDADYRVKGKIISTKYKGKMFSYGFSVYAAFPWLIGLPASSVSNELEVELSFIDNRRNKTIYSNRYKLKTGNKVSWIYAMKSDFEYPNLLRNIYKKFLTDLSNEI
jgi:hypothetical protein